MDKKKIIIGASIAGGIVVIAGVILALVLTGVLDFAKHPATFTELSAVIKDRGAVNCEITNEDEEGTLTIQANDGWAKFRMFGASEGSEINMWAIEGDATYMVLGDMAVKNKYDDSMVKDFINDASVDGEEDADSKTKVVCFSPAKNDFSIPEKDWIDMSTFDFEDEE